MLAKADAVYKLECSFEQSPQIAPGFGRTLMHIPNEGLILEFGVASGNTFWQICSIVAPRRAYGFDWFYGLPEDWNDTNPKGKFSTDGAVPHILMNGELIVGLVQDTLDEFLRMHRGSIAFAHLDMDLYSSTKFVLEKLAPRCGNGTVLLFDEIVGNAKDEEAAFLEFLAYTGFDFEFVTRRNKDAIAYRLLR